MTDAQFAAYESAIVPVRNRFHDEQKKLEEHAAAGVARDLKDLGGVHGDVIAFIEGRWTKWLDVRLAWLTEDYNRDAARIREEVGL